MSNKNKKSNPDFLTKSGYIPLRILAEKYGYAKDHIGRLARTGRIQAVRCGNRGEWYALEASVVNHKKEISEKRFSLALPKVANSIVLSPVPLNESSYNAKSGRIKTALFVLSMSGLLISGGMYYGIIKFDAKELKTKSANLFNQVDQTAADIFAPLRQVQDKLSNFVSNYLLPEYPTGTYLVIDPYDSLLDRIK